MASAARLLCVKLPEAAQMNEYTEARASEIAKHLADVVKDAMLEYEHAASMHRFIIKRGGLTYSLSFPDWILRTAPLEELKNTIGPAIERILLGASPRRIWVGAWPAQGVVDNAGAIPR
jgi:hypothetical protein